MTDREALRMALGLLEDHIDDPLNEERIAKTVAMIKDVLILMDWSKKSIEERVTVAINYFTKRLAEVNADGRALLHDTYRADIERYTMASCFQEFLTVLRRIKEKDDHPL